MKEDITSSSKRMLHDTVTEHDVALVVEKTTGIPVGQLMQGEAERLLMMEEKLQERVVGQAEATAAVAQCVRLSRAGLLPHTRPLGVFLFLGPTGVGKTELTKALCEFLFQDEAALTRIDMSEYMERFSVSRLTGAPPGYVGYEEGGMLTEAVRRRPYQVLLFDEFEKAHREVSNLLLQVFDEGKLTDSQGRAVDFRNTVIIMTSNLGSELLQKQGSPQEIREGVLEIVRHNYVPEFLNRIDEIIIFNRIKKDQAFKIVQIQLNQLQAILKEKDITLCVTNEAMHWLAEKGFSYQYGARPLKRAIQTHLMNPLATMMLKGDVANGQTIQILADEGEDQATDGHLIIKPA